MFAGGCTVDSAEAVADADLDTLQSLVEKSLLRHTDDRFWMLETIREYAVERLAAEEGDAIHCRHAEFFRDLADSAGVCVEAIEQGRPSRMDLALAEQANLRAALDWAAERDPALGLEIAAALEQFWVTQDPFEGQRRSRTCSRGPEAPPLLRARALRALGGSTHTSWQLDRAGSPRERRGPRGLYRRAGDEAGETLDALPPGNHLLDAGEIVAREGPARGEPRRLSPSGETGWASDEAAGNRASLEGDPR